MLWSKLHSLSKIYSSFISGDTIKIRVNENSLPLLIMHVDKVGNYFPHVDLSPPSRTIQINICLCCVLNYLVIFLNYTDFCVFLFSNLVVYSFFALGGKFTTSISTFAMPNTDFSNFRAFSLKNDLYWLLDFTNIHAQLFPNHQYSLCFLMNFKTTHPQQSIIFNLYSISTYNTHLFTKMFIIHIFAIFHHATDTYFLYIHFCFGIKIVHSINFYYFCQHHFIMNN